MIALTAETPTPLATPAAARFERERVSLSRPETRLARLAPAVGLAAFVATATMLFTAFTAAYLIRRTSLDFVPVQLPSMVWVGVTILVAVSVALERARGSRRWLPGAFALGLAFGSTQLLALASLQSMGIFIATSAQREPVAR